MKFAALTYLFLFLLPPHILAQDYSGYGGEVIPISVYGEDDRKDYFETSRAMQSFANSTVALFKGKDLRFNKSKSVYEITPVKLGEKFNLEAEQRFYNQPAISFCSGALVGDDLILTAGHCVRDDTVNSSMGVYCKDMKIVFGYAVKKKGEKFESFPMQEVFFCSKVLFHKYSRKNGDYAVIKLDRKASKHIPLAVNRRQNLRKGSKLFVIGYPSGLPVKIADNAQVRDIGEGTPFFKADLDTFRGNSGSPVFNAETFLIEGILSDGGKDYQYTIDTPEGARTIYDPRLPFAYNKGRVFVYEQDKGPGELVTKISVVENRLGVTRLEKAFEEMRRQKIDLRRELEELHLIEPNENFKVEPAIYHPPPEPRAPRVYEI